MLVRAPMTQVPSGVKVVPPGPGQESVCDFPRPPKLEPWPERIRIELGGMTIADTTRALRVLETSHPPTYYLPIGDLLAGTLRPAGGGSMCEWKGAAAYFDVVAGETVVRRAAWSYPHPTPAFVAIVDHCAFYCAAMDACWVGEHRATPQPGGFYGGWVTPHVTGPFKGGPGTLGW